MKYPFFIPIIVLNFIFVSMAVHSDSLPEYKNILDKKEAYLHMAKQKRSKGCFHETKYLYQEDYSWDYTFEEVGELYREIYESGKRLPDPVYYDTSSSRFMMPLNDVIELPVSWDFIFAIICHVEQALERNMADFIFLPDMGHGHFFLPVNNRLIGHDSATDERVFSAILNSKEVKILYHTAEMFLFFGTKREFFKLSQHEQFRNNTRNVLGSFHVCDTMISYIPYAFGSPVVHSIGPGYKRVPQDIDISANKNGAFPFTFKDKLYFFDISRHSPQCRPRQVN